MPTIQRPGATVSYDVVGAGPPVLLGHSLLCTGEMWAGVVAALQSRFRFINVDLRGHGRSTAEAPFTLDDLVDDWLAILRRESLERAAFCGLSTGGMTAMRLALREADKVLGLALMDTNAAAEPTLARRRYTALAWIYRHLGVLPRTALLKAMFAPSTIAHRPELTSNLVAEVQRLDRAAVGHAMDAVWGRDGVDISPVKAPTLVIVGEHDAATPPSCARAIAASIDGASLEVVSDAGHLTAVERPDRVAALLGPFFDRCFGQSAS